MDRRTRRYVERKFNNAVLVGAGESHPGPVPEKFHEQWERANNPLDPYSRTKQARQLVKAGEKPSATTKLLRRLRGFKEPIKLTLQGLAFHWEAAAVRDDHGRCQAQVNEIRAYHVTHGYVDIAYSFLFCNHGQVFIGRGWGSSAATCGSPWNSTHASACWMGGPGFTPSGSAFNAARSIWDEAYARGARNVIGHQQACSTQCPGPDIMNWIRQGMPGDSAPPPPPPPALKRATGDGMLIRDVNTSTIWLIGPGHGHGLTDIGHVQPLIFIGVPYAGDHTGMQIIQWAQRFGAWDGANIRGLGRPLGNTEGVIRMEDGEIRQIVREAESQRQLVSVA